MTSASQSPRPASQAAGRAAHIHPGEALQQRLAMALGGQRPIAYNVNLARAAGDVKAGLFLSQLLYWTRVGVEVDARQGWIFKTREQWTLETGLSRAEQERCRSLLLAAGLIQESRFAGSPARLGFRIQPEALGMAISSMLRRDPVQWTLFDLRSSEQHVRALLGRNMAFYRVYVDALGSVPLAVFVTKALEIQRRLLEAQIDKERRRKTPTQPEEWQQNWFSLSVEQWEIETALRAGQVRKCKQELCLSGILEEATQTWPRKRQFIRVDLEALSQVLIRVLGAQRATAAPTAGGLLQALIGRSASSVRRDTSEKISDRFPGNQSEKISDPIDRRSLTTIPSLHTGRSLRISPASTGVVSRQLARVSQSANPTGGIQQGQQPVSAVSTGTLNVSPGEFEHDLRRVSAPLHARASLGLQNLTTTTTTSGAGARRSLQVGSSINRRVVVVSSHQSQGIPDVESLAWPAVLAPADVELAKRLLAPAPSARRQALLDELAGRQRGGAVRNPIGYLRQLVSLDRQAHWDMVLELAHDEAERRAVKARAADVRAAVPSSLPGDSSAIASVPAGVPAEARKRLKELRAAIVSKPATLRQVGPAQSQVAVCPSQVSDAGQDKQSKHIHDPLFAKPVSQKNTNQKSPKQRGLESSEEQANKKVIEQHRRALS